MRGSCPSGRGSRGGGRGRRRGEGGGEEDEAIDSSSICVVFAVDGTFEEVGEAGLEGEGREEGGGGKRVR